ncbi:hypothetical protein LCM08_26535 [Salipiger pacificus]|nr:hypothetical protein [Alloyangia pacifica]
MQTKRKTPEQKIADLEQQEARIKARLQREKAKLRDSERKADTRRKIIAGAIALEHAEINPEFGTELWRALRKHVTRDQDRLLLGLDRQSRETS